MVLCDPLNFSNIMFNRLKKTLNCESIKSLLAIWNRSKLLCQNTKIEPPFSWIAPSSSFMDSLISGTESTNKVVKILNNYVRRPVQAIHNHSIIGSICPKKWENLLWCIEFNWTVLFNVQYGVWSENLLLGIIRFVSYRFELALLSSTLWNQPRR